MAPLSKGSSAKQKRSGEGIVTTNSFCEAKNKHSQGEC